MTLDIISIKYSFLNSRNEVKIPPYQELSRTSMSIPVAFIFTCAAIWVGLSSSIPELVKENSIYLRERLVNLGLIP